MDEKIRDQGKGPVQKPLPAMPFYDDTPENDRLREGSASSSGDETSGISELSSTTPPDAVDRLATLQAGDFVGGPDGRRFEIVERLGGGSMGVVHLARDNALERTVALKFITREWTGAPPERIGELFRLEARLTARLAHENIVRIFDLGSEHGVPFLVMEHLEGRTLESLLAKEEWNALRATRIMIDVARGLAHAHKVGVVHRDLKPSNIFVLKDGRAKILDFGLAGLGSLAADPVSGSSSVVGTPNYMPPEQWLAQPQDGRSDIWAAGVIFFELLIGRKPFVESNLELLRRVVTSDDPAPSLCQLRPDLPEEADRIVARALKKDITQRFGAAEELLDALVGLELTLTRNVQAEDARQIKRPRPERRQVTLLSCALADLMSIAERMEPDDFGELVSEFFEICATVTRQLEGTMVSHTGGRSVACFGYPVAHEDDAQRAVRAAFLISEAMQRLARRGAEVPAVQVGIHTGLAVAGRLSGNDPESPAVIQGDVPELTAWLERRARPGQILLTERTALLLRGVVHLESLGLESPEGARAIELYRAIGVREAPSRFTPSSPTGFTPLVGRDAEVEQLRALWEQTKKERGQAALVSGEAGIGKSRMVEVLRSRVAGESHTWLTAQCWSHFRNSALHPLVDCILHSADIHPDLAPSEKLKKLESGLATLRLPLEETVPLLATFLHIPLSPPYEAPQLGPDAFKNKLLETLIGTLLAMALRQPTLLIVEDLHWSDASTLELLDVLLGRLNTAPLMVLATFRPEFQPPWPERSHVTRIPVRRLSAAETATMVELASRGTHFPRDMMVQLVGRSDGIPLFVEELTRAVIESGASQSIPASLNELLLARLDRLEGGGKEVAQLSAVLGREFTYDLIRRAGTMDEQSLRDGLRRLVEAGLLRRRGELGEVRYVFKHALIQEAAYGSLTRSQQREYHRRAAEVLANDFPDIAETQPELLAHHYAEAAEDAKAIAYLEKAGQVAARRAALTDAETHYRRALQLLVRQPESPARDRDELRLQLGLAAPLMAVRGYANPDVRETYARARELCQRAGDDAQLFESVLGLWYFYMVSGEVVISADLGNQLLAQAEKRADPVPLMLAHRALGTSLMLCGDFQACREHTEQGLNLYDRAQHGKLVLKYGQDPGVTNTVYLAWSLWYLGFADRALERVEQGVELARALNHPLTTTLALNYQALVHNYRGEHQLAAARADEGMAIATEHELALWQAWSQIQQGWALLGSGERTRGADLLKNGVDGWTKTGAKAGLTFFLESLVWSYWQSGALDDAMRTIEELEEWMRQKSELFIQAELLRLRGEVMLARSSENEREAEQHFLTGLEIARRQKARAWELRLVMSLARVWATRGNTEQARQLVASSLAGFTEGFETADLRNARLLLQSLERRVEP
jgi:TOMM system kinase/cyclase fusion protein